MAKSDELYEQKLGASAFAFVPKIKAISKNSKGEIPSNTLDGLSQLIIAENAKGIKTDGKFVFGTASSSMARQKVSGRTRCRKFDKRATRKACSSGHCKGNS